MSATGHPPPDGLLGREGVRSILDERVALLCAGQGGATLLLGEPGSGRTAVVTDLVGRLEQGGAPGPVRVVALHVGAGEREWPFAAVGDLAHRLRAHLVELPNHLRRALEPVGAPSAGGGPAPVASAVTALLAEAASPAPLVVVVDDAHWLDEDSVAVLSAAARRLVDDRVLLVLAGEPSLRASFPGAATVLLAPLGRAEADALVAAVTEGLAVPLVRGAIVAAAEGNPLALVEVARALTADQLTGRAAIGDPLPVGPLLEKVALEALPDGDHPDRRGLAALALAGDLEVGVAEAVGRRLGANGGWLTRAEVAGTVEVRGGHARIGRAVTRAALVHSLEPTGRRAAHRAVAEALPDGDRRALVHLAQAATGPDEPVAAALVSGAEVDRRRGAVVAAASAVSHAAALSPDPTDRARRALLAARLHREAGHDIEVRRMLAVAGRAWADGAAPDPRLEAEAARLQAVVLLDDGPVEAALDALRRAADLAAVDGPGASAAVLLDGIPAALRLGRVGLVTDALADAERILDEAQVHGPAGRGVPGEGGVLAEQRRRADLARAALGVAAGGPAAIDELRIAVAALRADGLGSVPYVAECAGLGLVWAERYDEARTLLDRLEGEARAAGAPAPLATVRAVQGFAGMRQGRLADAAVAAAEAVRASEDSRRTGLAPFAHAVLAVTEALRGDADVCRASAEWLLRVAAPDGDPRWQVPARAALGLLALGEGRIDDAVVEMAPLVDVVPATPWMVMWEGDYAEALVRSGRTSEARVLVARLEDGSAWRPARAAAVAERLRGLLAAEPEDALRHLRASAAMAEQAGVQLGRGRALLAEGQLLRRGRRRAEARRALEEARRCFAAVGALLWERSAITELRACGAPVTGATPVTLTPQELQVARLVAAGASNRQVADALFISTRTVESHLGRTFRKLGLRSRTELASRPDVLGIDEP